MEVFFYGLFMDQDLLLKSGVEPENPRIGFLKDFELKIGNRASLIHSPGSRSYGVLMNCNKEALKRLYSEASVADYLPETVMVYTEDAAPTTAICYNLPPEKISGTNSKYANALYELAKTLDLPDTYLLKIRDMI